MKKQFVSILLSAAGLLTTASAATVQLIPPLTGIGGAGYGASQGRLTNANITSSDVYSWLGSRADGWYTTTGNGDMQWGSATANVADQTINLPNMPGTQGVCTGLKLSLPDMSSHEDMSFSFTLTPPSSGSAPSYTYSLWYGNNGGSVTKLYQETKNSVTSPWEASCSLTDEQIDDIKNNGDGKLYIVIGSAGGTNNFSGIISDISLEATVPEAATTSLGLLGLSALMLRRRLAA